MEWTDEIISRLQTLWQEGLSTAEIGRQLSITKNAVVGKAHRLGLPPRPSPIRAAAKSRKDAAPETGVDTTSAPSAESVAPKAAEPVTIPASEKTPPKAAEKPVEAVQEKASEVVGVKAAPAALVEDAPAPVMADRPTAVTPTSSAAGSASASPAATIENEPATAAKSSPPRKSAEAKTMAPDLMLRPLLRPLTADTSPRRGPACCWPNGDPGTPGFHFCGAKPVPGKPYCAEHCAIAYVKLRDRRESVG